MSLLTKTSLCLAICMLCPFLAVAQNVNLTTAGVTAISGNLDVMPGHVPIDNKGSNIDVAALGVNPATTKELFAISGVSNDGQCGPKFSVFADTGVTVPLKDSLLSDSGSSVISAAAVANYGACGGFGWRATVKGDAKSGNFLHGQIFFNNDIFYPFSGFAAFTYCQSAPDNVNDHGLFQRFSRSGLPVSLVTAGRDLPAGSHTLLPWFPSTGHESRLAGAAILSNGNNLYYNADRSRSGSTAGDKGVVEYYAENAGFGFTALTNGTSHRCNVHAVSNAGASAYVVSVTPTFVRPNRTTFDSDATSGAAAGNGWFACRANGGEIAIFRNNGTRITQIFDLATQYQNNDTLTPSTDPDTDTVALNRMPLAAGNNLLLVGARWKANGAGFQRPCILRIQVDATLGTATLLPLLAADDDYIAPAVGGDVHPDSMGVGANQDGDVVVAWRKHPSDTKGGGTPVARIYNDDGTAETGSFYVSAISAVGAASDTALLYDGDQADIKCALHTNTAAVAWFTQNGLTPAEINVNDCSGGPKPVPVSVAARLFTVSVADVKDWDLY